MRRFLRGVVLTAAGLAPTALPAHVFPLSYGTLALAKGIARIRLRISVHNLHPALEAFTGAHLAMKDEGYDTRLLEAYLRGRLELVAPHGQVVPFKFVAQEVGIEEIVLTLEAPAKAVKGWMLRNTILFEQSRDQKNYVTVEQAGGRRGLTFDEQHPLLPLPPPIAP